MARPRQIAGVIFPTATVLLLLTLTPFARSERLPIKIYTTADGLARDYINRIKQDSHGFIWFCTNEGISRFDGYGFTNYGVADGVPHRIVNDFIETRDGDYLFATQGGLVQFEPISADTNGVRFTRVEIESNELSNWVTTLIEDSSGAVLCGTLQGVYRLTKVANGWQYQSIDLRTNHEDVAPPVNALAFDSEGALLVGTPGQGLYRLSRDGIIEHYTIENGLSQNGISSLLRDRDGSVWVGTGTGLTQLRKKLRPNENVAQRVYKTKDGLLNDFIECLYQSSDGRLWVGTRGGLCLLVEPKENNGLSFRGYTTANGLQNIWILSITEDRGSNLWIGAESGGAMKMPLAGFTSYFETDQLGNGLINQLFSDPKGNVYAVAQSVDGLAPVIARFDGNNFVREKPNLPPKTQLTWGWNQLILKDHAGDWWIPTAQGIFRFSGVDSFSELATAKPRVYSIKDGMSDNQVFRLFEDARGDLWFSTLGNVGRMLNRWERSSDRIHVYAAAETGIPAVPPTAFANDNGGNLWIGFYTGQVCRYANGQFTLFTEKDGVPRDFVRDMLLDSKKRLWIATNSALLRVDDPLARQPQFISYTAKHGRASDQATTVIEDRWGQIYVGTGRGLDRLNPDSGKIKHYTTADGLADNFVNVSMRDSQGALWFGTYRGLSRLVPDQDKALAPPPIIISGLRVAGVKQKLSDLGETYLQVPELSYRQNQLQIDFLSISYAPGDVLRYQFKLESSGSDWSAPSDQRTITLANLAPGTYRFLTRAINSDGVTSSQPASVSFRILPPLWLRWWFITIFLAIVGISAYAAYRYRVTRLLEIERVRTRIATDLHDDIGAGLSRMAVLSEVVKRQTQSDHKGAGDMLTDIADSARGLVDSMSDIVWSIDPRKDDFHNVASRIRQFASDVLEAGGIDWEFKASEEIGHIKLPPEQRRHIYLIFKEAINNIARHSGCRKVALEIKVSNDRLICLISDDGRGFAVQSEGDVSANARGGNGLRNMQARALELGGQIDIVSYPGSGTQLTLKIPLKVRRPQGTVSREQFR